MTGRASLIALACESRDKELGEEPSTPSSHHPHHHRRQRVATHRLIERTGSFLSREQFIKQYFRASIQDDGNSRQRAISSVASPPSLQRAISDNQLIARATDLIAYDQPLNRHSSSCSSSVPALVWDDAALVGLARHGKKQIDAVAKRQVLVGKWKERNRAKQDCQVFDCLTPAKDQYSVVAKLNLPCTLREIMSVFSTDESADFHRSMTAVFGDQYVYGHNLRTIDCLPYTRRCSTQSTQSRHSSSSGSQPLSSQQHLYHQQQLLTSKLSVNAVSLLLKHHVLWKQQNLTFIDYVEENIDAKTVTRVLQTIDLEGVEIEQRVSSSASSSVSYSASSSSSAEKRTPFTRLGQNLQGVLAGYVIQEDSAEKFTRIFFYATHRSHTGGSNQPFQSKRKVPHATRQLLREMVNEVCKVEALVLRRRLGYYPLVTPPTQVGDNNNSTQAMRHAPPTNMGCSTCYVPFNLLRKKYFCHLCGHYTCGKCSKDEEIEKHIGTVDKLRVCISCVRRVSYCVFSAGTIVPKVSSPTFLQNGVDDEEEEEADDDDDDDDDSPPMLAATDDQDDSDDDDCLVGRLGLMLPAELDPPDGLTHRIMGNSKGIRSSYVAEEPPSSKETEHASFNTSLPDWLLALDELEKEDANEDSTTPRESICLLDDLGVSFDPRESMMWPTSSTDYK